MNSFSIEGLYRVQSNKMFAHSKLEGKWFCGSGVLSNEEINAALESSPMWRGKAFVNLRPALVSRREGKFFSEPDILYKRDFFSPTSGSPAMNQDIVDVLKSKSYWFNRIGATKSLFNDSDIIYSFKNIEVVITNEYILHEAGHFVGYDVLQKQRDGYFKIFGKIAWPLVYLEEFRADLNAFGFALDLLPEEQAIEIFLYNLFLRLGIHIEGKLNSNTSPYGIVPYLLFCLLLELNFISVIHSNNRYTLKLNFSDVKSILDLMGACKLHSDENLNKLEIENVSSIDCAIQSARYVRNYVENKKYIELFSLLMDQKF
jgi:hypothetical protein